MKAHDLREFVWQNTVILLPGAGEPWVVSAQPDPVSAGKTRIMRRVPGGHESLVKINENRTFFRENGDQTRPTTTKKRKFTNGVLVRALEAKPG